MPARRKARSVTGKPAGSMMCASDPQAGGEAENRAGILGNVGLVERDPHGGSK